MGFAWVALSVLKSSSSWGMRGEQGATWRMHTAAQLRPDACWAQTAPPQSWAATWQRMRMRVCCIGTPQGRN